MELVKGSDVIEVPAFWKHIRSVTLRGLGSDMTGTRMAAALTSFVALLVLLGPYDTLARPANWLLHDIFRHDLVLALAFALDFGGLMWRFYDPVPRQKWELAVNIWGFLLILVMLVSVIASIGLFTLSFAFIFAALVKRALLIVRSGNGPSEVGS